MVTSRQTFTTCPQQLAAIRKHFVTICYTSPLLNGKAKFKTAWRMPRQKCPVQILLCDSWMRTLGRIVSSSLNQTCTAGKTSHSIPLQRKLVVSKWQSHSPPKNIQLKSGTFLKYMWADKISDEWYRVQQWSPAILHSCNVKMPLYQNAANNWENKDIYIWGYGFAPICETCEIGRIKLHCWVVITRCIELWAFYWFVCEFFLVTY